MSTKKVMEGEWIDFYIKPAEVYVPGTRIPLYQFVCHVIITGKCLKTKQFLKAEHLLKHAFPYRNGSFYGPDH